MTRRMRGRRLQAERRRLFQAQPLCVECERLGKVRVATQRDHVIALCNGGEDTPANTQALCAEHHRTKTASDRGYRPKPRFAPDGSIVGEEPGG